MFKFLKEPPKGQSVSLTLLIVSFIALIIAGSLEMLEIAKSSAVFETLFITCSGLYFGRRVAISKDQKEITKE